MLQEFFSTDIGQGKDKVDSNKENSVNGHHLQPLQAGLFTRQRQGTGLLQPVCIRLIAEEGTWGTPARVGGTKNGK